MKLDQVLTPTQRRVAEDTLDAEPRRHVVVALSGAHAYGFPSPDSDLDLKAVHLAPTLAFLGLAKPQLVADRLEVIEGVEIDYTSNELGGVLAGLLSGNGNYLERILGPLTVRTSREHASLKPLAEAAISRRFRHHYRGFARSQLEAARKKGTAKTLLYVLRTALTGRHLLETGRLVVDLNELLDDYGFGEARELISAKRAGEQAVLDEQMLSRWLDRAASTIAAIDEASARSPLPEAAPNAPELDAWLVETRRAVL